jgi:hypothetical protein
MPQLRAQHHIITDRSDLSFNSKEHQLLFLHTNEPGFELRYLVREEEEAEKKTVIKITE